MILKSILVYLCLIDSVGEKTVGRLMRENNLRSQAMRKFRVQTTDYNHDFPIAPNWLNQHFDVCTKPNQVWVTDITYIHTRQGVLYLASVLDLFTRKIVGWQLGKRMKVDLVSVALEKASFTIRTEAVNTPL